MRWHPPTEPTLNEKPRVCKKRGPEPKYTPLDVVRASCHIALLLSARLYRVPNLRELSGPRPLCWDAGTRKARLVAPFCDGSSIIDSHSCSKCIIDFAAREVAGGQSPYRTLGCRAYGNLPLLISRWVASPHPAYDWMTLRTYRRPYKWI